MKRDTMAAKEECSVETTSVSESAAADSLNCVMSLVYQEHHKSLVAFLRFKLKSSSEANDIAQEAYARVLRHGLPENILPEDIMCARAYIFKTANNLALNRLIERRRKHEYSTADPQDLNLPSSEATPEEDAQCQDRLRALLSAVEELPDKCRKAFVLYNFEFKEYREIAEQMDLTESMIRKYVLRGMRHCRRRLDEQLHQA